MTDLYQTLRSVSDHHVFVVCRDGTFYELVPDDVRKQGPWQGQDRGEVETLKPEYRLALARDGYMLVGASSRCSSRRRDVARVGCRALAAASRYRPLGIEPKSLMTSASGSGWTFTAPMNGRSMTMAVNSPEKMMAANMPVINACARRFSMPKKNV